MVSSSSPGGCPEEECDLLYYRLMLPNWLRDESNVEWNAPKGGDDLNLIVEEDASDWENVLRLPLIPKGCLKPDEDITVKIKVGTILPLPPPPPRPPPRWRPPPRRRDPLSYMVTDKNFCVGIQIVDPVMYRTNGPYRAVEGGFGRILRNPNLNVAATVSSTGNIHPDQFELMIKPSETYGTAYSAVDSGHKIVAQYSDRLQLDLGLWLDLYRFESIEVYNIQYIEVQVCKNTPTVH